MTKKLQPLAIRLKQYARQHNVLQRTIELDYLLSWLLAGIASDPILGNHLVFKGGTALRKCYFNNYRFSEDLDFTAIPSAPRGTQLVQMMEGAIKRIEGKINEYAPIALTFQIYKEKEPHPDDQIAFKIKAQFPGQREPLISAMIEISFSERLLYPPNQRPILHSYEEPIEHQIQVYSLEEVLLEKMRAILQQTKKLHEQQWTRSRTRDYYDLYQLLQHNPNLFQDQKTVVNLGLKCSSKKVGFRTCNDFFDPRATFKSPIEQSTSCRSCLKRSKRCNREIN